MKKNWMNIFSIIGIILGICMLIIREATDWLMALLFLLISAVMVLLAYNNFQLNKKFNIKVCLNVIAAIIMLLASIVAYIFIN